MPPHGGVARVTQTDEELAEAKEAGNAKAKMSNFFRILAYGTSFDYFLMGLTVSTAIGAGAAMPLMFLIFGRLVNNFTSYFTPGGTISRSQFEHSVDHNALYLVYIFIGKWVLGYISLLCVRVSGMRISSALRLSYLRALFSQPLAMVDKVSPGKVASRITTSSNTIQLGISQQFSLFIQAVAFTVGVYVIAFIKSALLTLVASALIPFILIVYSSVIPFFMKIHKKTEDLQEEASSLAFEMFSSIRIVIAFGAEERLRGRYGLILDKAAKNERKNGPLMGLMMAPMFFATYATMALTFWFGIRQYTRGHIDSVGSITIVLFSVLMAVSQIGRLAGPIMAMAKAGTASAELFKTIDAEIVDTSGLKAPDVQVLEDIVFEDVSFAYPSRPDVRVLHNVTTTFEAGKMTAIVGPSGSGKSTIVGLIERWYDVEKLDDDPKVSSKADEEISSDKAEVIASIGSEEGAITIGTTNLNDINAKWWRSQIGLVQQEPFLFNDTIYKNVAYGLCGTEWQNLPKEEQLTMVKAACKEAYADEFINRLPKGYDTIVGESGIKLSGGQRQRLAIARSIVKRPPILILDEATSAIDVRTERIVQRALDHVSQNRTTIVIAHRLSTIKKADKIVVLRQGRVVEEGTHEQLLEDPDGVYRGLVTAQAIIMGKEEIEESDTLGAELIASPSRSSAKAEADVVIPAAPLPESDEDPTYKRKSFFTSFGLFIYEQRGNWLLYIIITVGALGGGVVYPVQAYIFAKLINAFTLTGNALISAGNHWSLMFFIQAIGVGIAYFMLFWSSHITSIKVAGYYRKQYLEHMLGKRVAFFDAEGNSAGTLTSRLSDDPHRIESLMGTEMGIALIAAVNIVGSVIIAYVYGWKLSLVGTLAVMPVILLAGFYRVKLEMEFEELNAAVFADSSQFGTEAIGAFRTVLSLIMEDVITDRYATLLHEHVVSASKKAMYGTVVFSTSDSIEFLCQALVFWYGGRLLATYYYNVTSFFVIYMAVIFGSQAAGMWFSFAPNIAQTTAASNRILSLRPPKDGSSTPEKQFEVDPGSLGIEFKDVNFTYKSRSIPVLTGLNIKIEPGQFVGLVGASGSGKSTIISLLERFYDPESGVILCGDQDITSVSAKTYRSKLALVAQESTLYEGTVKENVTLSMDEKDVTDEAIEQACKDAQIHDFIMSLPDGYGTRLGPKAHQLSGGQRQRLALARALLRKPTLLLLDEATSSLDSEAEKLVQEAIERAAGERGRTVVAVAHRLATIQNADVIFVIGSGKVLERGSHQELLKKRGVYYQMCQAQALDR